MNLRGNGNTKVGERRRRGRNDVNIVFIYKSHKIKLK